MGVHADRRQTWFGPASGVQLRNWRRDAAVVDTSAVRACLGKNVIAVRRVPDDGVRFRGRRTLKNSAFLAYKLVTDQIVWPSPLDEGGSSATNVNVGPTGHGVEIRRARSFVCQIEIR